MAEKKCNHCGTNNTPATVSYVVHESAMARAERNIYFAMLDKLNKK